MEVDRIKWNTRFESQESYLGERPSPFLSQAIERIKKLAPGHAALDIACGEGRNSIFLAQHGFRVVGLDISDAGLAKGRQRAHADAVEVDFQRVDLDQYVAEMKYDLILNFNFLLRELIPLEIESLNPGGLLIFDTIMASEQLFLTRNTAYLLQPGELVQLFEPYDGTILFSEEVIGTDMPTARILFQKSYKTP
jgi:2-polyprenyl-3-methyl-5-hydroxy-6-metoxy-1,4-benzoquinol methylase